jgi:ribose 5-phosphate isomerase B
MEAATPAPGDRVAIGADHAGARLKSLLTNEITQLGFEAIDLGTGGADSVDYPDYADRVVAEVADGRARWGVLVCGTGIGMSIAANRNARIRAALCHDTVSARLSRQHNDANVLTLGARLIGEEVAKDCVRTFLSTGFEGGRHARRVEKLGR